MTEVTHPAGNRMNWLSFAALTTAAFTFFGVNQTSQNIAKEDNPVTTDYFMPSGLVSFEQGTWEDPYKQLHQAKEAIEKESAANKTRQESKTKGLTPSELDRESLETILLEKLKDTRLVADELSADEPGPSKAKEAGPTDLLIVFSLVPGGASEVEARLRIRHSFEIAMASRSFRPVLLNRISFVRFPNIETHFSKSESVKYETEFPVKLYENPDQTRLVLNVWVNEDLLGEKPWHFLNSVASFIQNKELRKNSQLAILGPTTSDILRKLNPNCTVNSDGYYTLDSPDDNRLEDLLTWKAAIRLFSYQCTVPIHNLWETENQPPSKEPGNLQFKSFIKDDGKTMRELAKELRTRLFGNFIGKPSILLFVEQDREFGRYLGKYLKSELYDFEVITIGYLSGISAPNAKGGPRMDSDGAQVTDYFQRTLKRDTESWHYPDANNYKPAAIGILGGSWEDKIELLGDIRKRFPQPLCFTNDFDARYADIKNIPITRNLLIQSHQDPKPIGPKAGTDAEHCEDKFDIFFRDEYQAALFNGMRRLLEEVYPENGLKPLTEDQVPNTCIFEIGRDAALVIPAVTEWGMWSFLFSIGCVVTLAVAYLFPLTTLASIRDSMMSLDKYLPLPLRQAPGIFNKYVATGPGYSLPLLVLVMCMIPLSQPEMAGNRFLSLFSGVNVVPSIFCLSITIPLLFRRAAKAHKHDHTSREKRINTVQSVFEECRVLVGLSPISTKDSPSNVLREEPIFLACILGVFALGIRFWVTRDDPWLVQIGVLAGISYKIFSNPTSRRAVELSLGIAFSLGLYRVAVNDFAIVPSRDPWIRIIGNTVFVISYWWLLVSLLKLILYLNALREVFRIANKDIWAVRDRKTPVSDAIAKKYDDLVDQAGNASAMVLRDLGIVIFIGAFVCLARLPVFDAWGISSATWLTIFIPMALPFVMAVLVRRGAWKFRDTLLRYLTRGTRPELSEPIEKDGQKIVSAEHKEVVAACIESIKTYDRGTFCPLDQDPLISAGIALVIAFFSGPNSDIVKQLVNMFVV